MTHLLKFSTCFEHYPAHFQEVYVVTVHVQPVVSSLSAGDCPVHRLIKNCSFLTGAQDSHLQRVRIPEVAYIQLRRIPPEDDRSNARNMWRFIINVLQCVSKRVTRIQIIISNNKNVLQLQNKLQTIK
jgi:hypothetical protein